MFRREHAAGQYCAQWEPKGRAAGWLSRRFPSQLVWIRGGSHKTLPSVVFILGRERTTKESDDEWRLKVSCLGTWLLRDFKEALSCSHRIFEVEVSLSFQVVQCSQTMRTLTAWLVRCYSGWQKTLTRACSGFIALHRDQTTTMSLIWFFRVAFRAQDSQPHCQKVNQEQNSNGDETCTRQKVC